ncbi:MAG: hypothetical protein ACYS8W_06035 [Planctomycetota bacterium]|jgi:hypothetical protein
MYAWEQFRLAVKAMCGMGNIRERVINACFNHIQPLDLDRVPDEVRPDAERLLEKLTREGGGSAEACKLTADKRDVAEFLKCGEDILDIYDKLTAIKMGRLPSRE